MMLLYFLLVILTCLCHYEVNANCQMVDWSQSFKEKTLSECSNYIRGFHVNGKEGELNNDIALLDGVECCIPSYPWYLSKLQTVHVNWWHAFDSQGRVSCPEGFFLSGLRRTLASPGYLSHIEEGRCTKPADHPHYYTETCLLVDISGCTRGNGLCKCPDDHFVAGLGRDDCNELRCLKELKCCKMLDKPKEYSGLDDVKERIMDITHPNLALLGHYLGYGWAAGCMEPYVGEGYKRVGDTMEADKSGSCDGYKSDHRLNLVYGNWRLEVKNITYGERIVDTLHPETIDFGIIVNNDSSESTVSHVITKTVVRTVTHTVADSWRQAHAVGARFTYTISPFGIGQVVGEKSYNFEYETSSTTTNSENKEDSRQFSTTLSKTLEPYSKKKWSIILSKSRTTVPYTAVILAKFTVDVQGFLRWGGGYHGQDTNYHQQYRGSRDRPTFHYQFGDSSEPFYSALKKQTSRNSPPWQWLEIGQKYPYLQPLIEDLTKESHYEFTLSGKFEDVMGTSLDQRWDDLTKTKRETVAFTAPKYKHLKGLHIAKPGANDIPAKFVVPVLVLDKPKLCDFDVPHNISTLI